MNVLILGGAGMIGQKLARQLASDTRLNDRAIDRMTLVDIVTPQAPACSFAVDCRAVDITDAGAVEALIASQPDVIYHLAAVVSGEAERDMQKGYRINLDGTRLLLESIGVAHATSGYCPLFVLTSSIAVYGAPLPECIDDDFHLTPLSSYGTQKAMCELLLADYHRRGMVTAVGLRLPTICIRPGKPNAAASSFFSGILREPINGQNAVLPVADTIRHWFASPRAAVSFLLHAASLSREQIGARCNMNLPGLSATVAEQIESLRRVIGNDAVALIKREEDPLVASIVNSWPEAFNPARALALGFRAESSFDEIITVYLEDDFESASAAL